MKNSPGENTNLLLKHLEENPREVLPLAKYLDRFCKSWRTQDSEYFKGIQKLEAAAKKNKDKKKR